jgi:hypothetical protein
VCDRDATGTAVEHPFDAVHTDRGAPVVDNDAVTQPAEKDPSDWVTGDEPVTGPQQSYLSTLAQQAGEEVETTDITKAEASQKIEELKEKTGR